MIPQEHPRRSIKLKSPLLPIFVLFLLGLQLFFPYQGWVILLTGFGGVWLLSYLWAKSLHRGLKIERELRFGWKQVGDRLRERIRLENTSWAPSVWVQIDDHSDMNEYDISTVTDIQGYRYQNWYTHGHCDTRGLFTLGPVTLSSEDPFGLYQVDIDYEEAANMMVAPPVIALPEIEIASGGRVGEGRSAIRGVEQTISTTGVRTYVPGDSLRWLHWPTTARTGELYVHVFENEPSSDWWVLLDLDPTVQVGEGARSTEEHGVVLAASLVNHGIQRGKNVGMVTYGDELVWHPPQTGDSHLWSILRSLAGIHAGGPPLAQILERIQASLEQNTSLAIITPNLTVEWINALELLQRSGIVPTVLLLDPASFGGSGNVEDARRRLRRLGISHYTISAEMLDQPKKRPAQGLRWLMEQTRLHGPRMDKWQERWAKIKKFLWTWGLVLLFFGVMVDTLDASVRGLEESLIWFMVLSGALTGGLLARSRLPGWAAAVIAGLVGSLIGLLRIGRLWEPILDVVVHAGRATGQFIQNIGLDEPEKIDLTALHTKASEIGQGITALGERIGTWFGGLASGLAVYDPVVITFIWGIAIFGCTAWAFWWLFGRRRPFQAFLPALILLVVNLAMSAQDAYALIFLLGAIVALMAFFNFDGHEGQWIKRKLDFAEAIRSRFTWMVAGITAALMLFAFFAPSISLDMLDRLSEKVIRNRDGNPALAQSLGIENLGESQAADILDIKREGGMPNEHLIRSSDKLSDEIVMVVRVDASQTGIPDDEWLDALSPLYLRSLVYDRYVGYGWVSRDTEFTRYPAGEQIYPERSKGRVVRQEVEFVEAASSLLYTVGPPLLSSQDVKAAWRIYEAEPGIYDLFGATITDESYQADSLLNLFTPDQLRLAGQSYPAWMQSRYMSLPESVPESVLTLARDLTATETTPYDRAVAIERYLRQFPYTLQVGTGPAGVDITEYFLFTLQRGYCDYYATAMVVLARAAGMPARYVMGYIGEHYDEDEDLFIITADQAHAWAEVYFPGYGWVPFEPTGGRPEIARPPEPFPTLPDDFEFNLAPLVPERQFLPENGNLMLALVLLSTALTALIAWLVRDWWLARQPTEVMLATIFRRFYRLGSAIGLTIRPGDTPLAYADLLAACLDQLSKGAYWRDWLILGEGMIQMLANDYIQVIFNPVEISNVESGEVFTNYKQIRKRLWLLWLLARVYRYQYLRPLFWLNAPLFIPVFIEDEP